MPNESQTNTKRLEQMLVFGHFAQCFGIRALYDDTEYRNHWVLHSFVSFQWINSWITLIIISMVTCTKTCTSMCTLYSAMMKICTLQCRFKGWGVLHELCVSLYFNSCSQNASINKVVLLVLGHSMHAFTILTSALSIELSMVLLLLKRSTKCYLNFSLISIKLPINTGAPVYCVQHQNSL